MNSLRQGPGFHIIVEPDHAFLALRGARLLVESASLSEKRWGEFRVAISGGNTPRAMHALLAQEDLGFKAPWENTHIFWADERLVPYESNFSNYGAAKRDFVSKVPLPRKNIHPIPVKGRPEAAAKAYEAELKRALFSGSQSRPLLDLVFLGIGTDGHVASLFPGSSALEERNKWVAISKGGNPLLQRVTMTLPLINQAAMVVIMASGRGKADIVKRALVDKEGSLPATRVSLKGGRVIWLLDQKAASRL